VLDKEGAAGRRGIFMVDASKGYIKDGNKNRLRAQDIHRVVDTFTKQAERPKYSRLVPLAEIEANDFNLNLPRYIDSTEAEDLQDTKPTSKAASPSATSTGWTPTGRCSPPCAKRFSPLSLRERGRG